MFNSQQRKLKNIFSLFVRSVAGCVLNNHFSISALVLQLMVIMLKTQLFLSENQMKLPEPEILMMASSL